MNTYMFNNTHMFTVILIIYDIIIRIRNTDVDMEENVQLTKTVRVDPLFYVIFHLHQDG